MCDLRIMQIPEYDIFLGLIECCLYWQERGPHFKSSAEYTNLDRLTLWSFFTSCFCKIYSKINSKCLWNVSFSQWSYKSPSLGGYTVTPSTQFISFLVSTLTIQRVLLSLLYNCTVSDKWWNNEIMNLSCKCSTTFITLPNHLTLCFLSISFIVFRRFWNVGRSFGSSSQHFSMTWYLGDVNKEPKDFLILN